MAPSVKVRLEVDGTPEAIAAVRAFTQQTKAAGRDAASSFRSAGGALGGFGGALSGVTKLFAAYKVAQLAAQTASFTVQTVRLAAEQKDLALQLGTTVGNYSALAAVARVTNTEQGKLVANVGKLADQIKDLRAGSPAAVKAFAQLGLSAKDFASDDIVVNTVKVADAFEQVARGGTKGALATDALGKSGRALLPVFEKLNELGGLAGATEFARRTGFFVDSQTVAQFEQIAAELQVIELTARGIALQFAKGFGPHVVIALREIGQLFIENRPAAEAFGEAIGMLARGMAELVVHTVGWGTVLGDIFTLQWGKVASDFRRFDEMLKRMRSARPASAGAFDDSVGGGGGGGVDVARLQALQDRFANAEITAREAVNRALEARDKAHYDRGLISLDEYFARRRQHILEDYNARLKLLEAQFARTSGLEQQIVGEQIVTLGAQSRQALTELDAELDAARKKVRTLAGDIRTELTSALTEFATNGINQVHNLTEAFAQLGLAIARALQQAATTYFIESLPFLGGSAAKKAAGGLVTGPGTGTSDSIPAWLSNLEYVMPASRVRSPGMLSVLEGLRSARISPAMFASPSLRARGYADGGLVQQSPLVAGGAAATMGGQVTIALDDGLILRAIESPAGQRVMLKVVAKNPRAFGAAIRR